MIKKINKYQAVRNWLKKYEAIEPGLVGCYYLDTKSQRHKIRILIVSNTTIPCYPFLPLGFPADDIIPYEHIIVEVTPDEFEKIKKKELLLPEDWKINYVFKGEKLHKNERGTNKRVIMLDNAREVRNKKKELENNKRKEV